MLIQDAFRANIPICHDCKLRVNLGAGKMVCGANAAQTDIREAARAGNCPRGFFSFTSATVDEIRPLIASGEILAAPGAWQKLPNVQAAYREALTDAVNSIPPCPADQYKGRGVCIIGLGTYWASAYVSIRMSRSVWDGLPIELWGLPGETIEPWQEKLLRGLNVTVRYPGDDFGTGRRTGWRLKTYAMLHSRFEQVRVSDADSYPVEDPAYFWDSEEFRRDGAIYFQDRSFQKHDVQRPTYRVLGVNDALSESNFESGQFFIDKRRCWRAAWLANWLNCTHSEYFYHVAPDLYGDKDLFRLAHRLTSTRFALPPYVDYQSPAFIHFGFDGKPRFVHRVNGKLATREINYDTTHQVNYRRNDLLPLEDRAWEFLAEVEKVDPEAAKPKVSLAGKIAHGAAGIVKALTGTGGASKEVVAQREAICEKCPHVVMRLGIVAQCKLCGCATAAKIRNANEQCPDKPPRWLAVNHVTRYTLCTYHDAKIASWAGPAAKLMEAYAKRHGYRFVCPTTPINPNLPANWQRVSMLIKELPDCDFAAYLDADALVTNPIFNLATITALDPAADLFIASDQNGINNGVMIWRSTKASRDFLFSWERAWAKDATCDQRVMRILLRAGNLLRVCNVDQRLMNSSVVNWQEGDWILHFAGIPDKAEAIMRRIGGR